MKMTDEPIVTTTRIVSLQAFQLVCATSAMTAIIVSAVDSSGWSKALKIGVHSFFTVGGPITWLILNGKIYRLRVQLWKQNQTSPLPNSPSQS